MPALTRRTALLAAVCLILPAPLAAAETRYRLDPGQSKVGFGFTLAGTAQTGTMPLEQADILIDPVNLAASHVDVTLAAAKARAGPVFVNRVLTGPGMLDVARFPAIRFVSTRVLPAPDGRLTDGARIRGLLTLRDVTRPVELKTALYRARGTPPGDLRHLTILLTGQLNRRLFGLTGYPDLVGDTVTLNIAAVIRAAE